MERGLRVRKFFDLEARSMLERYKVIETLLPHEVTAGAAHRGEEGRYLESLVRDFLNRHLPASFRAVSGFILRPSTKTGMYNLQRVETTDDRHSTQLDVIVYDVSAFPVYERFEEFCIVPPEGVVGIISIKKTLYSKDIADELRDLAGAAELCRQAGRRGPYTGIFAFSTEKHIRESRRSVFSKIEVQSKNQEFDLMVNEISVLEEFVVFKFNKHDSGKSGFAKYVDINCNDEQEPKGHIVLQRLLNSLLSVCYDPSRTASGIERPGFTSFEKGTFAEAPVLGFVPYRED